MNRSPSNHLVLAIPLAFVAAAGLFLHARTGFPVLAVVGALALWSTFATLVDLFGDRVSPRFWLGLIAVPAAATVLAWRIQAVRAPGASTSDLQLTAVVFAVLALLLRVCSDYASRLDEGVALRPRVAHARLYFWFMSLGALVLIARLYTDYNLLPAATTGASAVGALLVVETLFGACRWWYLPGHLQTEERLPRESALLGFLFADNAPLRSLLTQIETVAGTRFSEIWVVRLARHTWPVLALFAILMLWGLSAVSVVPTGSEGLLLKEGRYQPGPLPAGLHVHYPWPFESVRSVSTSLMREVTIGYERDLNTPVLWTEKHFDGEQNLLVGNGDELLTFNVPILYRVKDVLEFSKNVEDADQALRNLGHRVLIEQASTRSSFEMMTTARAEFAETLRKRLQEEANDLHLGVEITWVGLKDVHPPVAVAAAFQEVISAEEERVTMIDQAHTYAVQTTNQARISALGLRRKADTDAWVRRLQTAGSSARFLAPLPVFQDHQIVFRRRLEADAQASLFSAAKTLQILPPGAETRTDLFLGFETPSALKTP